ncbi:MAG: pantoate--beta-alanine ligase [Calditrichaeota bacterium]|nr:MAG: pantoate--beta-alanine ligase [Calditrichota bacterium]MBL1204710.1 pantoate--beta-alanine ligase [Calditrichota bacterium]NOG44538.1 pantoate--beta-alanine ligase [Calditrichota bacterium]
MKVIKTASEVRDWSRSEQQKGCSIGLVPTMGFLHEGHLSLIRKAKTVSDKVIVSIFVNPTQFAQGEDLDKYPIDIQGDLSKCQTEGVDAVFIPDNNEMYSDLHQTYVINQEIGQLLCGASRPTHFRGVNTVVAKLFNLIDPDFAVFGQKDAQQSIIIKNMVRDLSYRTQILVEPIIREKDGLAMSSRNKYLNPQQRKNALILSQSINLAYSKVKSGNRNFTNLEKEITENVNTLPECKVDYVEFVNADTLHKKFAKGDKVLLAIAVFVGTTRLIDNAIITI